MTLKKRIYRFLLNLRQRSYRLFCLIIMCLAAVFGLNHAAWAEEFRVDGTNGSCSGDGSGWGASAFKYLQDALNYFQLAAGDQIWVAAGWYYVDQSCADEVGSGDRAETFQLVKDVFLLGGFNGTETFASERDSVANPTILSGAILQGQDLLPCAQNMESCFEEHGSPGCLFEIDPECCTKVCDEDPICCLAVGEWDQTCADIAIGLCGGSYHVVTAGPEIDDPEKTVIDGFTIQEGTANGTASFENEGGGMFIQGEPSVVRCTFTSNAASAVATMKKNFPSRARFGQKRRI